MSVTRTIQPKNAPLSMPENREACVRWAIEQSDDCVAAGWQAPHPLLCDPAPRDVRRDSLEFSAACGRKEQVNGAEANTAPVRCAEQLRVKSNASNKAAALLEKIAKRADASLVLKRSLDGLLGNARSAEIGLTISTDPGTKTVTAKYAISADVVLAGISSSAEEILEYLKTGLSEFESACLSDAGTGKRYFIITQLRQDDQMIQKIHGLLDE